MGAPRHPPEAKDRAFGALYASCEEVSGELVPNVHAVAKKIGIDANTLYRWWNQRDRSLDGEKREAALRARALAAEAGAVAWYRTAIETLKMRLEQLLQDENRFKEAGYDEASRGLRGIAETLHRLKELMPAEAAATSGAGDLEIRVQTALKRQC